MSRDNAAVARCRTGVENVLSRLPRPRSYRDGRLEEGMENKIIIAIIVLQVLLVGAVCWNKHTLDEQAKHDGIYHIILEVR